MDNHEEAGTSSLDLVWGAAAIAKLLNLKSVRQAFWLLENGQIPARKVGHQWVGSKAALEAFFNNDAETHRD